MDLRAPCNFCTSLYYRKPAPSPHRRQLATSPQTNNNSSSSSRTSKLRRRITTTSELQTPQVGIPSGTTSTTTTDYPPPPSIPSHKVTVHDTHLGITHEFYVPEDQYILHTAEAQNISLPFACRHGCCTSCAVRIKSGQLRQPEALGISAELKAKCGKSYSTLQLLTLLGLDDFGDPPGYALLCVGYPSSDIEVETQDEDEVYWLQFGRYFARGPIERDDYALELALGDE